MKRLTPIVLVWLAMVLLIAFVLPRPAHAASELCKSFKSLVQKEGEVVYGPNAPTPMFMAQLTQESSCRDSITAWDNGRGAAQFMDGTAIMVANKFPELGPPDPYNRKWAVRAMIRLDRWNESRIKGDTECDLRAASLKGYNAGLGYVQQAQKVSPQPGKWFEVTEHIPTRQSAQNFEYSRTYPRKILFKHQLLYQGWGPLTCAAMLPNQK